MPNVYIQFDPASLGRIKNLLEFDLLLYENFKIAMGESLDDLEGAAQDRMWSEFMNPQGALEDAFEKDVYGWDEAELSNPSPYAFRRNYGFSGMTDSLGRFFRYDWGIAYMEGAIVDELDHVQLNFQIALDKVLIAMGAI